MTLDHGFLRRLHTFGMVVAITLLATSKVWAQTAREPRLTFESITEAIGSDADARGVFLGVFAHLFPQSNTRKEFLLSAQIRPDWLPTVDGVSFVLLNAGEAEILVTQCGSYWVVSGVKRSDVVVSLTLSKQCSGTMREYVVSFDGREWKLGPPGTGKNGGSWAPGIGSGFVGGPPPGCPCLR